MNNPNILLVEGEADRGFYEALLKQFGISADVKVVTPKDSGGNNSKQGILKSIASLKLGDEASVHKRLAVVLDADSAAHGGGCQNTLRQLTAALDGYSLRDGVAPGLRFSHPDGLNDIGAWLMPNNAAEGMVEDWIKTCLHPNEATLMAHAQEAIQKIPGTAKFKALHQSKAEVATWLAWQERPGHGLYRAAEVPELLDQNAPLLCDFKAWLQQIFPAEETTH